MKGKVCAIILFYFLCGQYIVGQIGTTSVAIEGGLSSYWNPAINQDGNKGFQLWLGEVKSSIYNSSFALEDIISSSGGKNIINFNDVIDRVDRSNYGFIETVLHTVGIKWRNDHLSLGLGHRIRYIGDISYSDEMINLIHRGNAGFIGQEVDVGPGFSYFHYNELYVDAAYRINGLSIGGRFKLVAGSEYMGTEDSRINMLTHEDFYTLEFSNNYLIQSSGIFYYNGLNDVTLDFDPGRFQKFFSENRGWAMDVGVSLDLSNHSKLMFSLSDLGSITWDKNTSTYLSQGKIDYDGVDILDYVADSESVVISDSLYQLLQFQETRDLKFSTSLPWQWALGFTSSLRNGDKLSVFVSGNSINSRNRLSVMGGYHRYWSDAISTSVSYTVSGKSYNNLGITALFDFDAVGFYIGVDNFINIFRPFATTYGGIQFGLYIDM